MIAEGGTERGHGVSVARGPVAGGSVRGPPGQPGAQRPQHLAADPEHRARRPGRDPRRRHAPWSCSACGRSARRSRVLSPGPGDVHHRRGLGRRLAAARTGGARARAPGVEEQVFDFADPAALDDPGWLAVRTPPADVASVTDGRLVITGDGSTLADAHPRWVGRRQRHLTATVSTRVDASAGAGGLAARYDEQHWFALEARTDGGRDHGDRAGPRRRDGPGVDGQPARRRGRSSGSR